jgi:hypothetical protein
MRLGLFTIDDHVQEHPELAQALEGVAILRSTPALGGYHDAVEHLGVSMHFRPVAEGEEVPYYNIVFHRESDPNTRSWVDTWEWVEAKPLTGQLPIPKLPESFEAMRLEDRMRDAITRSIEDQMRPGGLLHG